MAIRTAKAVNIVEPARQRAEEYLLCIRSGPNYDLEGRFGHLARVFGEAYQGEIWTFGSQPDAFTLGPIRVTRLGYGNRLTPLNRIRWIAMLAWRGIRARWLKGHKLVIVAYDPLQSGIAGLLTRWLTGGTFVCEVNGVFGDPDNFVDIGDPERGERKRKSMLRVGSFILRRAHLIKLLFPNQLEGFDLRPDHPPRVSFPNLVSSELFSYRDVEPEKMLLFVGYGFFRKGADILLRAFGRLQLDFPEWTLTLIGHGLEQEADALQLPRTNVRFLKPLPPEEIPSWLERARALVLPSRSEAMGRVLLEAAFMGRARITTRSGGPPHVVEHEVYGLLAEPGSVEDLERTLRHFMSDPELQEQLSLGAKARAARDFTGAVYLENYRRAIDAATRRSSPSSQL